MSTPTQPQMPWPSPEHYDRFVRNVMHPAELELILSPLGQAAIQNGAWADFWAANGAGIPHEVDPNPPAGGGFPQADPRAPVGFVPPQQQIQGPPMPQYTRPQPQPQPNPQPQQQTRGPIPRPAPRPPAQDPIVEVPPEPNIDQAIHLFGLSSRVIANWLRESSWEGVTLQASVGHGGLQLMVVDIPPEEGDPEIITGIEGDIEDGREGEALYQVLSGTKQHVEAEMTRLQQQRQQPRGGPRGPMGPLRPLAG